MGAFGIAFLGEKDNDFITEIAKEKNVDRDVVEVEYKEMLKRLETFKKDEK